MTVEVELGPALPSTLATNLKSEIVVRLRVSVEHQTDVYCRYSGIKQMSLMHTVKFTHILVLGSMYEDVSQHLRSDTSGKQQNKYDMVL